MRSATCCFLILGLLASLTWAQTDTKVKLPTADRNAFTFLDWKLDTRIEPASASLYVRGSVTVRNDTQQPQTRLSLQISSSLKWASVKQGDKPLEFLSSEVRSDVDHSGDVQEAVAVLSAPVGPGANATIDFGYSGTIPLDTTRLAQLGAPPTVRASTDYDRISPEFICLRGVGHVLWFPVALEPAIMGEGNRLFEQSSAWGIRHSSSTMELTVIVDGDQKLFSNATKSVYPDTQSGQQQYQFTWAHIGIAGPVIAGGPYRQINARGQGKTATVVAFLPGHQSEAEDYARVIRETPALLDRSPAAQLAFLELPESSDATFAAGTLLLTPIRTTDRNSLEVTVAFELAQQSLWSPRAWIDQGVAHFTQALMREREDGRSAALAFMSQRLTPLALVDSGAAENAKTNSLVNTTSDVFFRTKAMYVWWMLREIVGQRALLDSLTQYDPQADKEPSYMQRLLEKNSHKDLEWFFDDWVYQDRGLPELVISNGYARPSLQGIYLVSATIENTGGAAAEVPVIVSTDAGEVVSRLRVPAHTKTASRTETGSKPTAVTVNDGSIPEADRSDNTSAVKINQQ